MRTRTVSRSAGRPLSARVQASPKIGALTPVVPLPQRALYGVVEIGERRE